MNRCIRLHSSISRRDAATHIRLAPTTSNLPLLPRRHPRFCRLFPHFDPCLPQPPSPPLLPPPTFPHPHLHSTITPSLLHPSPPPSYFSRLSKSKSPILPLVLLQTIIYVEKKRNKHKNAPNRIPLCPHTSPPWPTLHPQTPHQPPNSPPIFCTSFVMQDPMPNGTLMS